MTVWIVRILVAIATAAIARGIVAGFALDAKVARLIQVAGTSPNLTAVAWRISGLVGLGAVIGWDMFHVSQRLEAFLPFNRPVLGSLSYVTLIVSIEKHQSTGKTDVQMSVEVKNFVAAGLFLIDLALLAVCIKVMRETRGRRGEIRKTIININEAFGLYNTGIYLPDKAINPPPPESTRYNWFEVGCYVGVAGVAIALFVPFFFTTSGVICFEIFPYLITQPAR